MVDERPVLLDTDVFSLVFITETTKDARVDGWRRLLLGRTPVIAIQTRAEALTGALTSQWGSERHRRLLARLDTTPTIPVDSAVADRYASLTADLRKAGMGMHDSRHTGDRWIAATALTHGLQLLAGDGIHRQVPGLELLAENAEGSAP